MKAGTFGLSAILLVAAALRLWGLTRESLWLDEIATVDFVARHTLLEVVRLTFIVDFHPFAYYALLDLWSTLFGTSDAACRSFSVLIGTVSVAVVYRLARRATGSTISALVAAAIIALGPTHVWYSQECRMYVLTLLAWGLCLEALLGVLERFSIVRMSMLLGAFCVFSYAHASAGFTVLPFLAGAILVRPDLRERGRECRADSDPAGPGRRALMVGLLVVAYAPWMTRLAVLESGGKALGTLGLAEAVRLVEWLYLFAHDPPPVIRVAFWAALVATVVALIAWPADITRRRLALMSASVIVPLVTTCVSSSVVPFYQRRNLFFLLVPLTVLIAHVVSEVLSRVVRSRPRLVRLAMVAAVTSLVAGGASYSARLSVWDIRTAPQKEDWRSATHYLLAQLDPRDVLVFYAGFTKPCFDFYAGRDAVARSGGGDYQRARGVSAIRIERDGSAFAASVADLVPALERPDLRSVWVVYSHVKDVGRLETILNERDLVRQSTEDFHQIEVVSYRPVP